jgi:hypothetical protein
MSESTRHPTTPSESPPANHPLLALVFVLWCFIVGTLLMYAPWLPVWLRWTAPVSSPLLHDLLLHPALRGAVTGFGLFHLVWGTHDLDRLLHRWLQRYR